jgi:hypothetical protein
MKNCLRAGKLKNKLIRIKVTPMIFEGSEWKKEFVIGNARCKNMAAIKKAA